MAAPRYSPSIPQTNLTYAATGRASPTSRHPLPMKKVVIVGGGSAGWMAAMLLADALIPRGVEITVLESPTVGIIGVGEGSTPWLRGFFEGLGIEEAEWMPECNATYKCGITFDGWSTKPGFASYFHPFASVLDNFTVGAFVQHAHARLNGADVDAHPDRFFIATRLARAHRAPRPARSFPFDIWYGYHFDAVLLGQFLHRKALARGVRYRSCHVKDVVLDASGDIASVTIDDGGSIAADFFIDCTGFSGMLIQKALGTPFLAFAENLFNDAAVAIPSPMGGSIPSETVSSAMRHGWMWKIPLTSRYGNGYVYSSAFCSADEAERELRERLGMLDDPTPARHLKMRTGRVTHHWNRNCLAVGLSQGFIEPLEATALLFIQRTVATFVEALEEGDFSGRARQQFNDRLNAHFEGTRDYIVSHYKTNSRKDTEYWRANSANGKLSEPLMELYSRWLSGAGVAKEVGAQELGRGYPIASWYSLLAGMGCFPDASRMRPPRPGEACDLTEVDHLLDRSALNFPDQRAILAAIPPREAEKPLQLYFW